MVGQRILLTRRSIQYKISMLIPAFQNEQLSMLKYIMNHYIVHFTGQRHTFPPLLLTIEYLLSMVIILHAKP